MKYEFLREKSGLNEDNFRKKAVLSARYTLCSTQTFQFLDLFNCPYQLHICHAERQSGNRDLVRCKHLFGQSNNFVRIPAHAFRFLFRL